MRKKIEKKLRWDERKVYPVSSRVDTFIRKLERVKISIIKKYPEVKPQGIRVTSDKGFVVLEFERYMTLAETREWEKKRKDIQRDIDNPLSSENSSGL